MKEEPDIDGEEDTDEAEDRDGEEHGDENDAMFEVSCGCCCC